MHFFFFLVCFYGWKNKHFPYGSAGKESACNTGDLGSIPGLGRSHGEGKGYPLQCSGLENSMDSILHGVAKSWTRLSDFHYGCKNQHFGALVLEIVGNCFYKTSCIILSIFWEHLIISLCVSFCRANRFFDLLDSGLSNIWASESTAFPEHLPCSSCGFNHFRSHGSRSSYCSLHSVKEETEA